MPCSLNTALFKGQIAAIYPINTVASRGGKKHFLWEELCTHSDARSVQGTSTTLNPPNHCDY